MALREATLHVARCFVGGTGNMDVGIPLAVNVQIELIFLTPDSVSGVVVLRTNLNLIRHICKQNCTIPLIHCRSSVLIEFELVLASPYSGIVPSA